MEQITNTGQDQQIVVERRKVKELRKKVVKKGKEHVKINRLCSPVIKNR